MKNAYHLIWKWVWDRVKKNKWLFGSTSNTTIQMFRSIIVGGIALICDVSVLIYCVEKIGYSILTSATLAFFVGTLCNYILSTRWVFVIRKKRKLYVEWLYFVILNMIGLILNNFIMWVGIQTDVYYLLSKGVACVLVFTWSFSSRKWLLFKS